MRLEETTHKSNGQFRLDCSIRCTISSAIYFQIHFYVAHVHLCYDCVVRFDDRTRAIIDWRGAFLAREQNRLYQSLY